MSDPFAHASAPVLQIADGVATLTLNRPAQRNKLENGDLQCLLDQLDAIERDPQVRVLVLTANTAGQPRPVFCAGYDIGGFETEGRGSGFFEQVPQRLAQLRPVTLCALNGSVYGGATDLVLACDFRVAMQGMHWRMPACALGLHYYPSGLRRYVSRLGLQWSKRAFLLGEALRVEDLAATGVFETVAAPADFEAALQAVVAPLLRMAPSALKATKQSLNEIAAGLYSEPALKERSRQSVYSQDFAEGRAAFAEKRAPRFTGQ